MVGVYFIDERNQRVKIHDALRMCLAFDQPQFTAGGNLDCEYCKPCRLIRFKLRCPTGPDDSKNLPRAMMSMNKGEGFNNDNDVEFRDKGVGIYSGSALCASSTCETIQTFNSHNFKETVNGKTPEAYVEEMQQRIRVDGFSANVCEARLAAQGVLQQDMIKSACAEQRVVPNYCGEACPDNMECRYDATQTFGHTCQCKAGVECVGTWNIVLQARDAPTPSDIPYSTMTASQSSNAQNTDDTEALVAAPDALWPGTCTHTQSEENAWWKVSLSGTWDVTSIRLTGRAGCCPKRLQNIDVFVGNTKCASDISVGDATKVIPCVGTGNIIKLQHRGTEVLSLCGFTAKGALAAPEVTQVAAPTPQGRHLVPRCTLAAAVHVCAVCTLALLPIVALLPALCIN